ncbi:hypothetical protein D9M71_635450 [compost metagenome]
MLGQVLPQPDNVGHRPVGDERTKAAMLFCDIQHHLRIARHALELAQVADDALVVHQPLQVLGAHQHHLLRVEAEEHLLERRPLGIHQAVLEPGAEHAQGQGRQVAVVADVTQLRRRARLRQEGLQGLGRAEAAQAILMQPLVIAHGLRCSARRGNAGWRFRRSSGW